MANLGFLATVCVLGVLAGQVNGQCPDAAACFNDLGINITNPAAGLDGIIKTICSKSAQVSHCYDVLLQCALIAPDKTVLPTEQEMQMALQTLCQNQTELDAGITCLVQQPKYPTEIAACALQIQKSVTGLTPAQERNPKGLFCSLVEPFFNCVTSMSSFRGCNSDFKNTIIVFEKQLLPADCPISSGSPRLDSWLFLGVIAALVASSFKRL
ncbi:uncharacterized protein LOC110459270 [Mizuhopecten yessoensis]|uniref:27 kDa hemolymph protein n=1 Tax=Mizuhopecten yessoensis TaxID=6573 RepID=A0A210Q519_MIZYE|nr:uncharacterized protein LOC110459270 [Mizuhopecten yessoensis]OWF43811.1 hypothetical protein KP79_PYT12598 [Mizuhopecten yessoensis]